MRSNAIQHGLGLAGLRFDPTAHPAELSRQRALRYQPTLGPRELLPLCVEDVARVLGHVHLKAEE